MTARFENEHIALLTQHGKERVIAPVLEPALACRIERVAGYDTDQLGTFTRDTPRPGTQLDAARRKARIGMELSGLSIGLASEGSFGPDPMTGMLPWNVELIVLIDDRLGLEVAGVAQGVARSGHVHTGEWNAVESFAERSGFPEHQLVMRPEDQDDPRIYKGITRWSELRKRFAHCRAESASGKVFVEIDFRAFANPSRMRSIGEAAKDLLRRLESNCPACGLPGYWVVEREPGLPCAECRMPTSDYRVEVWACPGCRHRVEAVREDRMLADPAQCPLCNP